MLASYAKVFSAVEGNTAFYHVPTEASVEQWRQALEGSDCKINFKLPKTVTHESRINQDDFAAYLKVMKTLKDHRGPYFIQFPASVGPDEIAGFEPVFDRLAMDQGGVIEVRHPGFFSEPESLEPVLNTYGFGRVIMDSRSLYQGDINHPEVKAAIHEKPDLPIIDKVYNNTAFVRLNLHPDGVSNGPWIDDWASRVGQMLIDDVDVTVIIHCPNNQHCPSFAREFQDRLSVVCAEDNDSALDPLPAWPVPQQGSLW